MDEFPPNRITEKQDLKTRPKVESPTETKKIEKVVTSEVVRRKKSFGTKLREMFVGADADTVKEYVVQDVLVPALKDMISDASSGALDRILYGDSSRYNRRRRNDFDRPHGHVAYNRMGPSDRRGRSDEHRRNSPRRKSSNVIDEVILATRAEAQEVLDRMYDLLQRYEAVSVSDLNELLGLSGQYTDDKWGWLDLRGSDIRRLREGYLLTLPDPEPLD